MILRGNEGDLVEVTIVGYEFPHDPDPETRFSWHVVAGNASLDGLSWRFQMAALTCDESPEVSAWLRQAADCADGHRSEFPADLTFLEPNLGFRLVAVDDFGQAHIEVDLDLEFRHPDVRRASSAAGDPTAVPVQATGAWLRRFADEWDGTLVTYPPSDST